MVGPPSTNEFVHGFVRWTKATRSIDHPNSCLTFFKPARSPRCIASANSTRRGWSVNLEEFAKETPIALVLPCHVRELGTPALRGIVRELKHIRYLKQIVVGIDGANAREWRRARRIFCPASAKADAALERRPTDAKVAQAT